MVLPAVAHRAAVLECRQRDEWQDESRPMALTRHNAAADDPAECFARRVGDDMIELHPCLEEALNRWIDCAQAYALCVSISASDEDALRLAREVREHFRRLEAVRSMVAVDRRPT
jgi:hypothetical protein